MARDRYFRYEVVGLREGLVQTAWRNVGDGVPNMMSAFLVLESVLLFWARVAVVAIIIIIIIIIIPKCSASV
jgi:hypothetical protein